MLTAALPTTPYETGGKLGLAVGFGDLRLGSHNKKLFYEGKTELLQKGFALGLVARGRSDNNL